MPVMDKVNAATEHPSLMNTGVPVDVVTPTNDDAANDPEGPFRYLRATGAGAIKVTTPSGDRVMAFLAGETRPVACLRVWSTGTTATGIEGMV